MRVHQRLQKTQNQNYGIVRVWIVWQVQVSADIREQLNSNWLSMSVWQYGKHILVIYDCEQAGFLLMFNLWKMLLEYQGQNSFGDTVKNIFQVKHRRINWELKHFANKFLPLVPQEVQWQISLLSPRYYQSNEPIILNCVFCKNVNQSEPEG